MQDIPTQKALLEIFETRAFDKLDPYADPAVWQTFSLDDQKLLAKLLVMKASTSSLKIATQIVPDDSSVWYARAKVLSSEEDAHLLEEASLCFEKAISLQNNYFDAWYSWGNLFIRRALILDEPAFLTLAEEKLAKAETLLESQNLSIERVQDFYWQYGFLYFMIGRSSEEAVDLHKALQYYRKARELGFENKEFLNDFGNALVELSLKISQAEMIYEAIELYLLSLDEENAEQSSETERASRYFNLGSCYHYLFGLHHDEVFFKQAEECFLDAIKLHPVFLPALKHLADLLLYASKLWQDVQYLQGAVGTYAKAAEISDDDPMLLIHWSEALCHLGTHEENLEMLQQAEALADIAIQKDFDLPEAWGASGLVLYCLGRYFEDDQYYIWAQDKIEYGLSLNQEMGFLWHQMANIKFTYGEEKQDLHYLEEAIVCFHCASKGEMSRFGYFWNDWAVALLNIADITQDPKIVEDAVQKFEQSVLCQEQVHPQWLINFGSALDFLGDLTDDEECYEKAIQILSHTITIDPESISARYQLGLAYCHFGELSNDIILFQRSVEELQKVIEQDPEDENAYNDLGLAFLHIAEISHHLDVEDRKALFEQAKANFLQAQSLGSLVVLYNLACLCALQGNLDEAILFLKKVRENGVLPRLEDIVDDKWLEQLRNTPQFREFIQEEV